MKNLYPRFQESYQEDELIEHFWLTNDEIVFVETFRNEVNRQTVAILLKSLDHLGYLPDSFDQVPEQVKLFIARQLNSLWEMTTEYDWLSSAKDRHCLLIREFSGWNPSTAADKQKLIQWLQENGVNDGAEQNSDGRIFPVFDHFSRVIIGVKHHLSKVLMRQFAGFEVNQNKAFQQTIIQHEINIKMVAVNRDALLSGNKTKAFAHFEQKILNVIEQSRFNIRFAQIGNIFQIQKLQNKRVFDKILRVVFIFARSARFQHLPFIFRRAGAFKEKRIDLPFKLAG